MIKNFKQFLNESKKQQSIPNGTEVTFDLNGVEATGFGFDEEEHDSDWWEHKLDQLDGKKAIIEYLATYTELGDKNYEYYDIEFGDGTILYAVSGYHLTPISNETFKYTPHNNPDLTSIKKYLDEKGFKYFTPADVDGIFDLEFAVVLQVNPAMEVYAKSINGVKATGKNEYSFKGYDGTDYDYLENALLIIEGKNAHSSININNVLDKEPIIVK